MRSDNDWDKRLASVTHADEISPVGPEETFEEAIRRRPEVEVLKARKTQAELYESVAKNRTLPSLDLVASATKSSPSRPSRRQRPCSASPSVNLGDDFRLAEVYPNIRTLALANSIPFGKKSEYHYWHFTSWGSGKSSGKVFLFLCRKKSATTALVR